LAYAFLIASRAAALAQPGDDNPAAKVASPAKPYEPRIAQASEEARLAMRSFRVPPGLAVELFAAEPLLANPVAFCVDEKGVFYVAETFRHGAGVTDTRSHMNWLDADLACRTVADRVATSKAFDRLIDLLADSSPRVRFFAAISLGKLGRPEAVGPLLAMLRASADRDPYLRHAGVMGLAGSRNPSAWKQAAGDRSAAVRMAILFCPSQPERWHCSYWPSGPNRRDAIR